MEDINLAGPALPFVAIDSTGDVIIGGNFRGNADFGNGPVSTPSQNLEAGWLSKRSGADGTLQWAITLGTNPNPDPVINNNLTIDSIHVDGDGNVLVAGAFQGSVDLGGQILTSNAAGFIARYSGSGALVSAHTTIGSNELVLASDGSMYVAGFCSQTITFPNQTESCGTVSTFFAALNPDGTTRWGHVFAGAGHHMALTPSGLLIINGTIDKAATLGTFFLDPAASQSRYVAALTTDGDWQWARVLDDGGDSAIAGPLVATANDHIVSAGVRSSAKVLRMTELDGQGHVRWSSEAKSNVNVRVMTVSPPSTAILGGPGDYALDFGSGPFRAAMFLAAYDDGGRYVDSRGYGDPGIGIAVVSGLATSPTDELAVSGSSAQLVDFGTGPVSGAVVAMFDGR